MTTARVALLHRYRQPRVHSWHVQASYYTPKRCLQTVLTHAFYPSPFKPFDRTPVRNWLNLSLAMAYSDPSENSDPVSRLFGNFSEASNLEETVRCFQQLCEKAGLDESQCDEFYASLKQKLTDWRCQAVWKLLDERASLPVYRNQQPCKGKRVLIVGAGPVGLRGAIEAALLGAKVDLLEKRTSFSRNNVLHLWPFLLDDLKSLCAKKFYGKFASGAIDHISK